MKKLAAALRRFAVAAIFVMIWTAPADAAAETLKIGGTGGDLGTMRQLGDAFEILHPDVTIDVLPSLGSGGGIRAILAGAIDLSISGRTLKDDEKAAGVAAKPYAITALVVVTTGGVGVSNLTLAELAEIYSGTRKNWPDGNPIRLVLRPETETDTVLIKAQAPDLAAPLDDASSRRGILIGSSDQQAADLLERMPRSMGFLSLSLVLGENRPLMVLDLDGVKATPQTIANGQYGLVKTFYLVSGPNMTPTAQAFTEFLESPRALEILANTGHAPASPGA